MKGIVVKTVVKPQKRRARADVVLAPAPGAWVRIVPGPRQIFQPAQSVVAPTTTASSLTTSVTRPTRSDDYPRQLAPHATEPPSICPAFTPHRYPLNHTNTDLPPPS